MKRNLTQQLVAVAVLALVLGTGASQAAPITYTYNSSTPNWYATGWTATASLDGYVETAAASNYLQVYAPVGNSAVPSTLWRGAQWEAPAGQNITHVTLTYSGIINLGANAPDLTIYAGTSAGTLSRVFTNTAVLQWTSTSTSLTFSATNQYRFLQVRNWDFSLGGYEVAAGWASTVSDISITVPEPVSLSLLALGGCWLLRRRRG
jgi:hypothetical protein